LDPVKDQYIELAGKIIQNVEEEERSSPYAKDHVTKTCVEVEVKLDALPTGSGHKVFRSDGRDYFKESGLKL
jgi:hypothetical protein